ncbi:HAD-IA family hydrolase [Pseudonocardia sp.]|uniref:HAD-IA family hydrolase n=1 Tax=Pseudonocardia sp. TaxID=60912 RepID=UPI00263899F1|nr:HAD-IA family hydrolase [Pseudonocardia sp.]
MLTAVLFDVDGTLADTERDGHRPAFNRAFAEHGLADRWDVEDYGRLLSVTGGQRRIERFLAERGHPDPAGLARALHRAKTEHFVEWVRSGPVRCRPGVDVLLADLRAAGLRLGVVTTGRRAWVAPLLDRLFGPAAFETVVTGDDVERLKPAPDAYLLALRRLGLDAAAAVAVEDSPPGLAAARAAGLPGVVVTNGYTAGAGFPGAAAVLESFDGLDAAGLRRAAHAPATRARPDMRG